MAVYFHILLFLHYDYFVAAAAADTAVVASAVAKTIAAADNDIAVVIDYSIFVGVSDFFDHSDTIVDALVDYFDDNFDC
jgi:hypothetical protein